jgi:hypothetical protein
MRAMRVQARITLPEAARSEIDALRVRWNPELVTGNPAHVTVVYHDEAPDVELLRARLERACRTIAPFALALGTAARFPPPELGIHLAVADPTDAVGELRRRVLAPPFQGRERFGLHVTLLHPAFGARTAEAWPALSSVRRPDSFRIERIDVVTGTGAATETLESFPLGVAR